MSARSTPSRGGANPSFSLGKEEVDKVEQSKEAFRAERAAKTNFNLLQNEHSVLHDPVDARSTSGLRALFRRMGIGRKTNAGSQSLQTSVMKQSARPDVDDHAQSDDLPDAAVTVFSLDKTSPARVEWARPPDHWHGNNGDSSHQNNGDAHLDSQRKHEKSFWHCHPTAEMAFAGYPAFERG